MLCLAVWPQLDLAFSGLFATSEGFYLKDNQALKTLTQTVFYGARVLAAFLLAAFIWALIVKKESSGTSPRVWLFLLLSLLIGPGLMANVVFKDHWGRARPKTVQEFGGASPFTPAFVLSDACHRNCSFVSGDAAFGFFLPSFAYVVPRRLTRRVFQGGLILGGFFSVARILLGAHFLSDVLAAMFLVLVVTAASHALIFGRTQTQKLWKEWLA